MSVLPELRRDLDAQARHYHERVIEFASKLIDGQDAAVVMGLTHAEEARFRATLSEAITKGFSRWRLQPEPTANLMANNEPLTPSHYHLTLDDIERQAWGPYPHVGAR